MRALQPAALLLAAVLVDALLEHARLAPRAHGARVPPAAAARPAPPDGPLAQLDLLVHAGGGGGDWRAVLECCG